MSNNNVENNCQGVTPFPERTAGQHVVKKNPAAPSLVLALRGSYTDNIHLTILSVFRIRIRIGSVFSDLLNPDPDPEA